MDQVDTAPVGDAEPLTGLPKHVGLRRLRARIVNLDSALVHLLAERFKLTESVGRLKAEHLLPPSGPEREAQHRARLRRLSSEAELNPALPRSCLRHHEASQAESAHRSARKRFAVDLVSLTDCRHVALPLDFSRPSASSRARRGGRCRISSGFLLCFYVSTLPDIKTPPQSAGCFPLAAPNIDAGLRPPNATGCTH